jgi:hypothetical protein
MHIALTQKGQMKVHFYSPNSMIFQKKHLNDVEVHIFSHFQIHTTIMVFKKPLKIRALKKSI